PERADGWLFLDLRALKLESARLRVELLGPAGRIGLFETFLSAEPDRSLAPERAIDVRLDLPSGVDPVRGWPVTFGVPMPAGAIWDAKDFRVTDAAGKELPSQIEVSGRWHRDGAVKWLRVDTLVDSEHGCRVVHSPPGAGAQPATPLTVTERDGEIV